MVLPLALDGPALNLGQASLEQLFSLAKVPSVEELGTDSLGTFG